MGEEDWLHKKEGGEEGGGWKDEIILEAAKTQCL